ncbi:MAG: precorrin-2 C(20)-methyltransferase [Rhodospirillaceae bacterium]|nr:precorrin-2 C(20)-methyltransferase [Rhodospirillaceae bacterium]
MSATLYGVGVGPGDPELLTLKAVKVLAAVPVIAYVAPRVDGEVDGKVAPSLARAIAAPHLQGAKTEITIAIAMREDPGSGQLEYDRAAAVIADHLAAGRDVAMLCEGDPLLYGSFMYVLERLRGDHKIITVPGVSALSAAAAQAGVAMVSRRQSLMLVPATLDEGPLEAKIKIADAIAVFKVGRHLDKVRRVLGRLGRDGDAIYIENASLADAKVTALSDAPGAAPYFSMVLVPAPSGDSE